MTDDEDSAAIDEARRPAPGHRTMTTPPDGFVHRRELDEVRALLCVDATASRSGRDANRGILP